MSAALLIAGNFVREQRWLALVLLAWVLGSSLLLGLGEDPVLADAVFFLQQQSIYGIAFGTFLAASAIQNERRSRRILSVLSKGIERREYITGLLLGVGAIQVIYALAIALGSFWMLRDTAVAFAAVGWLLLALLLTAMLAAAVTLFFSTFLSPLFSLAATAITIGLPTALALAFSQQAFAIVPVYPLIAYIIDVSLPVANPPHSSLLGLAAIQAVGFWAAAAWSFGRRDIAAAIE